MSHSSTEIVGSHSSTEIVGSHRILNAVIKVAMIIFVACGFSILSSQSSSAAEYTLTITCTDNTVNKVYDGSTT